MIIIFSSGRLGNQLFQYAAAKKLCQEQELLIGIGFEELHTGFDGVEILILNQRTLKLSQVIYKLVLKLGTKIINVLLKLNFFSMIEESKEKPECRCQFGLVKNIKIIRDTYFQNEFFFEPQDIKSLQIKSIFEDYARKVLKQIMLQDRTPIFIHVRRGDYCFWPSREYPAILPANYYHQCIQRFQGICSKPFFIFTSDDPFYVEDIFSDLQYSYISRGNSFEDLALMSRCSGGILSASSFAWWGAYLAKQQNLKQSPIFLSPEYWSEHRLKAWRPNFVKASFLNYISVS